MILHVGANTVYLVLNTVQGCGLRLAGVLPRQMPAADCPAVDCQSIVDAPQIASGYKRGILDKSLRRTDEGWRRPRQRMQMAWQKVASFPSMAEDGVTGVNVDGITIALYRLGDEIFATHGICTHALAFLSDGWVEDGKIECPLHQGQFDIRTGKALCSPVTEDLRVYPVKRDGDDILINLSDDAAATETAGSPQPADLAAAAVVLPSEAAEILPSSPEELTMNFNPAIPAVKRVWPNDDLSEIPDWVYTDQGVYDLEVEIEYSMDAPGTTLRSKPKCRSPATLSVRMSAQRRSLSRAPTMARSTCSRTAVLTARLSSVAS